MYSFPGLYTLIVSGDRCISWRGVYQRGGMESLPSFSFPPLSARPQFSLFSQADRAHTVIAG